VGRDGVDSAFTKWLATEKATNSKFCPDNDTMKAVGFFGILGTSRGETASKGVAKKSVTESVIIGRDIFLVEGEHNILDLTLYILHFREGQWFLRIISRMATFKAIVFDLNGVFLLSKNLSERLSEKSGKAVDEILAVMKPILREVRNPERRGEEVWQPLLDMVGMNRTDFFEFYFSGESIDMEMLDFAKSLKKKGVIVFILSNNFRERTEYYRTNFPLLFQMVDKAYFSWETGLVKPDVRAYTNLLNENNLDGEECIYIDDSEENLEVARSLGIKGIKYESGEQVRREIDELVG